LYVAATLSRGTAWPDGTGRCILGETVIASFEDDAGDTAVPRLIAEGADLSKIIFLETVRDDKGHVRPFDATQDVERLAILLRERPDVRLVVIDPISACMIGVDSHNNAEVRAALTPLVKLAADFGVCFIAITHLSKGHGASKAINRVMASVAFTAAARIVHLIARDPADPERRLFVPIKSNVGQDRTGLAFRTEVVVLPGEIETVRIVWDAEPITATADEVVRPDEVTEGAKRDAMEFLQAALANGPVSAMQVQKDAFKAKIAPMTLRRAREALGVVVGPVRLAGRLVEWTWALPTPAPEAPLHTSEQLEQLVKKKPANARRVRLRTSCSKGAKK
jgi:putative DNA primase/helicase